MNILKKYFPGFTRGSSALVKTSNNNDLDSELVKPLSYSECQFLYNYIPLAKRIITNPIEISMSKMNVEYGINGKYNKLDELERIDLDYIKSKALEYISKVRLYGLSVIFPVVKGEKDISNPLIRSTLFEKELDYNILEPLQMTMNWDLDPTSYSYNKLTSIGVNGKQLHRNRALALTNKNNRLFLQYNNASLSFSGLSELQIARPLLNLLNTSIMSLERQMLNSSLLLLKETSVSNINTQALQKSASVLPDVKQNSVAILKNGLELEQFQLNNLEAVTNTLHEIGKLIALSTNIPSKLFLDESLGEGFNNGSADSALIDNYLTSLRKDYVYPVMKFLLGYEIYNKIEDYILAKDIADNINITYDTLFHIDEQIKASKDNIEELDKSKEVY